MTDPAPTPKPKSKSKSPEIDSVIIRPWPQVVYLYPTFLTALVCWLIQLFQKPLMAVPVTAEGAATEGATAAEAIPIMVGNSSLGWVFMCVLFVNLLLFSFDFSRIKSITILIAVVAAVLALGWADATWDIAAPVKNALGTVNLQMNTQFYGFMSAFLAIVLLIVIINTRFNYYEVNHREILHHHGYLGDITRMPTQGLRLNKEIYDLLEYVLLRSGRLIFLPSTSREAIVIDNVIGVNSVEDRIKDILSVVAVRVTEHDHA